MRTEIRDRYYRVYTGQDVDRVPDIEFGYWPQTIRRWQSEGLDKEIELTLEESTSCFPQRLDLHLGFEPEGFCIWPDTQMYPKFEEQIIEKKESSVIMRGADGSISERYLSDSDDSSIPHTISSPVKTPADWEQLKERYDLEHPERLFPYPEDRLAEAREAVADGKMIKCFIVGMYAQLRNWMGVENLSLAFYDYPDMIRDMMATWTNLIVTQIEAYPQDIPVDMMDWWEDMAGKHGPLVSPSMFHEVMLPGYQRIMDAARKRGCALGIVDSDGDPSVLVNDWMSVGVNIMFPLEVTAGCDAVEWRDRFGPDMCIRGALDKRAVPLGKDAILKEFERIRPAFEQGKFIPHLDHLVPPDISLDQYRRYLDIKREFIGK